MPLNDEENDIDLPKKKVGKVSSQKSIFETLPKKPNKNDFEKNVQQASQRSSQHKIKGAELAQQFNTLMADKTLPQNKTKFHTDIEIELLTKMLQLAIDINNDPNEQEGMGSLGWITVLIRTCFSQRDKINNLEYQISKIEKRLNLMDNVKK